MADHLVRCTLGDRPLRVVAAITTELAGDASRRHRAGIDERVALARASTAGLLLATLTKGGERVTLQIAGDGPIGGVVVDADDAGSVRGYLVRRARLGAPGARASRRSIGPSIGRHGVVHVLRDLGLKDIFRGQSELVSGEVDDDVESYLSTSEQIESALGCDVVLADSGEILASGGVLIQCLPSAESESELVSRVREAVRAGSVWNALSEDPGRGAADLARAVLGLAGTQLRVLDERPARFACKCSSERVLGALTLIPDDELETMIEEDGGAEVTCDFCAEIYWATADELRAIRAGRRDTPKA